MYAYSFPFGELHVVVCRKGQVLRAEIQDGGDWMQELRRSGLGRQYVREWPMSEWTTTAVPEVPSGQAIPSPVHASIAAAGVDRRFVPALALAQKARAFDERLWARIDVLRHRGRGPLLGRRILVERLRDRLIEKGATDALALLDASLYLLGVDLPADEGRRAAARRWIEPRAAALAQGAVPPGGQPPAPGDRAERSKIAAFDRMLEEPLPEAAGRALFETLHREPTLLEAYRWHGKLIEMLSGPSARPSLLSEGPGPSLDPAPALFPAADPGDHRCIREVLGDAAPAGGGELRRELVSRVRGRTLRDPDRLGWPGHRLIALAALLEPDAEGLIVGPRYREELEEIFGALLGLERASRAKQLVSAQSSFRHLHIAPFLTVEPLTTYYRSMAEAYRLLEEMLSDHLGEALLNEVSERGVGVTILDELDEIASLFRGAWVVAREELGRPVEGSDAAAARTCFRRWQAGIAEDPDLRQDARGLLSVSAAAAGGPLRARALVGFETRILRVEFVERPAVDVHDSAGRSPGRGKVVFEPIEHSILAPVILDFDVARAPSRAELQALCDGCRGAVEIQEALRGLGM